MPFNWLSDSNVVLYVSPSLGTNAIFVGDQDFDYAQQAAEAQVLRLAARAADDGPPMPPGSDGGGGGGAPFYGSSYTFDTNGLFLEITNTDAEQAYLNLHNATNQVYALWSKTNLPAGWQVETEVWPTNGAVMPFTVPTLGRSNLFVRAEDWTGVTENGNTTPDWWFWKYFGTVALSDTNLDSGGVNTLLYDYQNGLDPNVILFSVSVTNLYVNQAAVPVQIALLAGVPSYYAVLVNDTNAADANWQPYTPGFTVALGPTDGVYNVWIGLRGHSADSQQTWAWTGLTRDLAPPAIVITAPVAGVTSQPMIDLRGYSPERLLYLFYDVANDAGTVTNVQGFITDQYLDPNSLRFTTNWFLCADIQLTNGANTVTLRATDLAGNVSTNVFTYTLDLASGTNPPVLALYWPQDGETVCGTQFTLRGRLDDPTATVAAQITDNAGNVNAVNGLVERNGLVWVENLPLAPGTNTVTLTMTNAAGYSSITNLAVVHSDDVNLTMDDVPQDQLSTGLITVTGTINSANFTVWVNGVMATNLTDNGDGAWSWEADDVPLNSGGTATIQAVAIPNSVNGGQGTGMETPVDNAVPGNPTALDRRAKETDPQQDAAPYVKYYHYRYDDTWELDGWSGAWENSHFSIASDLTNLLAFSPGPVPATGLLLRKCTIGQLISGVDGAGDPYSSSPGQTELDYLFPNPKGTWAYITINNPAGGAGSSHWAPVTLSPAPYEIWEEHTPYADIVNGGLVAGQRDKIEQLQITLRTGGKRLSNRQNFFRVWGMATNYATLVAPGPWTPDPIPVDSLWLPQPISPGDIRVLGKPLIGYRMPYPQGMNYKALPDNQEHDFTPVVQAARCKFTLFVQKCTLRLTNSCPAGGDNNRTDLGVGEVVDLKFNLGLSLNDFWVNTWTTTAGSVFPTSGNGTLFTAPSNAASATVTATLRDEHVDVGFAVYEPSGVDHADVVGPLGYDQGLSAAGMQLMVYLAPTNVSFYRVQCMEVGQDASGIWGYYTRFTPQYLGHTPARGSDAPIPVNCDNSWDHNWDKASWVDDAQPSSAGGFTWVIPGKWWIGSGPQHDIHFSDQVFANTGSGTMTVTKFGHTVTRSVNQYYGVVNP